MPRRSQRDFQDEPDEFKDEATPRRRPARAETDETPRRRRPEKDDEVEEDKPRRRRVSAAGWGQYRKSKAKTATGGFSARWKPTPGDDEVLIKFLDDEPFASYALHWFNELTGKKGFVCLESLPEDEECPACSIGDRPKHRVLFTVLVFDGRPEVKVLEAGAWLAGDLEKKSEGRHGPLSKYYWAISATGGGKSGPIKYDLQVVREDELEEDWDITPPTKDEFAEFRKTTYELEDVETISTQKELASVVRSLD